MPRFLACDPGAKPVAIDPNAPEINYILPTDVSQPYEAAIFAAVHRYRISAAEEPDEITMTDAARRVLAEDWNRFCAANNGTPDQPFEAQHTENAIRIALVLHVFTHVEIQKKGPGTFHAVHHGHERPLDEQTFRAALQIRDWFTRHQDNLRRAQRAAAEEEAWRRAQTKMRDCGAQGITARDLYSGHVVCDDADAAQNLLAQWKTEGRIQEFQRKPEGAGRPTIAYRLSKLGRA